MSELTPDQVRGIEFRDALRKELGLIGRNMTLYPHSYIQTTYHLGCDDNAAMALAYVLENLVKDDDVPPSFLPEIKYLRELFRVETRKWRRVDEQYPEEIFDRGELA